MYFYKNNLESKMSAKELDFYNKLNHSLALSNETQGLDKPKLELLAETQLTALNTVTKVSSEELYKFYNRCLIHKYIISNDNYKSKKFCGCFISANIKMKTKDSLVESFLGLSS
jgi:hypothetical protein